MNFKKLFQNRCENSVYFKRIQLRLTRGLHCPTTRCLEKGDVQSVLRKVVFDVFIEGMLIDDLWRDLLLCPLTSNVTNNNPIIMVMTPTRVIKSFFMFTLLKNFIFYTNRFVRSHDVRHHTQWFIVWNMYSWK